MIALRRLCRTADGEIVEGGDARAAFLVVGEGGTVPHEWRDAVAAFLGEHRDAPEVEQPERSVTFGTPRAGVTAKPVEATVADEKPTDDPDSDDEPEQSAGSTQSDEKATDTPKPRRRARK